jgi:hypothetical protein
MLLLGRPFVKIGSVLLSRPSDAGRGYGRNDLHAWLCKDDPLGIFRPTNPDVTDGYDYSLLEQ